VQAGSRYFPSWNLDDLDHGQLKETQLRGMKVDHSQIKVDAG